MIERLNMFNNNYTPGKVPVNGMQLFFRKYRSHFFRACPIHKEPAHPVDEQAPLFSN